MALIVCGMPASAGVASTGRTRSSVLCRAQATGGDGKGERRGRRTANRRDLVFAATAGLALAARQGPAQALFGFGEKEDKVDPNNPYAKILKDAGRDKLSAESLYEKGGGACGNGYELKVEIVVGSSCVCVDQSVCGEGTEGERKDISQYERFYGQKEDGSQ